VTPAGVVSWLAIRELWMSFRLFVVLIVTVLAGAVVALLPAPLPVAMERLAIGLGVAAVVGGAVAAWSLATERRRGRTGWLIARAVPRASYLSGWFVALGMVVVIGQVIASSLGWLAAANVAIGLDTAAFGAVALATLAGSVAALSLGTLAGVLWPRVVAAALVVVVGIALAGIAVAGLVPAGLLPVAGAFVALADYREGDSALGPALVAGGIALVTAGVLLALARLALERVEL
jgi:hypothetical protein